MFVCTGNTCRSAALQAIARSLYPELKFKSCGTALRFGKKGEQMTPIMAKTIKNNKMKKAYLESKTHKATSCNCTNLMKVSTSNGILFVVADKNVKELKTLIQKCKKKSKRFKEPKIQKLTKKDIYDSYDDSCELLESKGFKCNTTRKKKERESYQKSFKELYKIIKSKTFKNQIKL